MKLDIARWKVQFLCSAALLLCTNVSHAARPSRQIPSGEKARVTGTVLSRNGDLVMLREKGSGLLVSINLYEDTKIERREGQFIFPRHPRMDVTAMVPGLTIEAEGVGNTKGELDARKISFKPDVFAIEMAEEQQIIANQATTERAQTTADSGLDKATAAESAAKKAQSAADEAQGAADQASADAQAAGDLGVLDAAAVKMINQRVSELDDYQTVAETSIYFGDNTAVLDHVAKERLDQIANIASSLKGYMIEITGYASSPGSRKSTQQLSEERAAAVADYLRETKSVPTRRILAPAGYGATHLFASSADPEDRPLDRRVDVKVLLNKAVGGER